MSSMITRLEKKKERTRVKVQIVGNSIDENGPSLVKDVSLESNAASALSVKIRCFCSIHRRNVCDFSFRFEFISLYFNLVDHACRLLFLLQKTC